MNIKLLFRLLGAILLVEAAAMLPALAISIGYGDGDALAFVWTILLLVVIGAPLRLLLKAVLFNAAVLAAYRLMLHLFGMAALQQEFAAMTGGWLAALLVLANVTFWMYDLAVARVFALYIRVLRPRIQKALH